MAIEESRILFLADNSDYLKLLSTFLIWPLFILCILLKSLSSDYLALLFVIDLFTWWSKLPILSECSFMSGSSAILLKSFKSSIFTLLEWILCPMRMLLILTSFLLLSCSLGRSSSSKNLSSWSYFTSSKSPKLFIMLSDSSRLLFLPTFDSLKESSFIIICIGLSSLL